MLDKPLPGRLAMCILTGEDFWSSHSTVAAEPGRLMPWIASSG